MSFYQNLEGRPSYRLGAVSPPIQAELHQAQEAKKQLEAEKTSLQKESNAMEKKFVRTQSELDSVKHMLSTDRKTIDALNQKIDQQIQ